MAAAIIAALKARRERGDQDGEAEVPGFIDTDNDGKISLEEMQAALGKVSISANVLLERLTLEKDLITMMMKMPMFLLCLGCFMTALLEFSPPASIYNVHRHLKKHFKLDNARAIGDFHSVFAYMEQFETLNEELQATSVKYWCESRYAEYQWDAAHKVPVWSCVSPRQHALTLSSDDSWAWSSIDSPVLDAGNLTACEDDDAHLQSTTGDSSASCSTYSGVCENELGLEHCRKTCGYCAPFTYEHKLRFDKRQVTMLPVMVYQTRYSAEECHGFAEVYDHQPYNEVLWKMPALDGKRNGHILQCMNRNSHYEGDYALELDCPDSIVNTSKCVNGKVQMTKRHTFHGTPVYPVMLLEPHHDIVAMETVEWLDVQTESVSLSTMIYTENVEIFTSLTVDYTVDEAGNVDGTYTMISYRDLIKDAQTVFIACLVVCIIGACFGLFYSVRHMLNSPQDCKWGFEAYELVSRSVLVIYPIVLLVTWSMQMPMAEEFDHLLHAFLDMPTTSEEDSQEAIAKYFEVKDHIYKEVSWLSRHNIVAYIVLYIQFVQLIFYFSAHPKMGVLTATVSKALDAILHFLALFWVLFLMLAFMAHWMLGKYIASFGTFGEAIKSQGRMIFGEFIYADGADDLNGSMIVMYWLYAFTFMLVVFFTLLNFFLAIIVEAFADVSAAHAKDNVSGSFWQDLAGTLWSVYKGYTNRWPSHKDLMRFCRDKIELGECMAEANAKSGSENSTAKRSLSKLLRELQAKEASEEGEPQTTVAPAELAEGFASEFSDVRRMTGFIYYYFGLCPGILARAEETEENDVSGEVAGVLEAGSEKPTVASKEKALSRKASEELPVPTLPGSMANEEEEKPAQFVHASE